MMMHQSQASAYIVDDEVHDGLRDDVFHRLVDNDQVWRHQRPDGLHLSLQQRVGLCHIVALLQAPHGSLCDFTLAKTSVSNQTSA